MSLTFRPATPSDTSSVLALVESAYRGDSSRKGWTTEADFFGGSRIDAAGVLAKITAPDGAVLLGFDDSDDALVVCAEVLRRGPGVVYFGMFAVDPLRQGGGIGRLALERVEAFVRDEWEARSLEMSVIMCRDELIAYYVRRGFRLMDETRPFPYGEVAGKILRDDLYFSVLSKEL